MSWKLAAFGCALMVMACAGRETNPLIINELRISNPDSGTNPLSVCYTGAGSYKSAILEARNMADPHEGKLWESITDKEPVSNCFTFDNIDLTPLATVPLELVLTATHKVITGKDGVGTAKVLMPAKDDFPKIITVEEIGPAGQNNAIRVNEDLGTEKVFIIDSVEHHCPITENGQHFDPPCYFMDVPDGKTLDVCIANIGTGADTVKFCADVKTKQVITTEDGVKTVTLDHANKISFTPKDSLTNSPSKIDIVIQSEGNLLNICPLTATTGDCAVTIEKSKTYDISIAYTDGTDVISYDTASVINRDLQGEPLTTEILEVYWNKDADYFQLTRDKGDSNTFTIADVDCTHMDTLCYVYFTGLTSTETYTLTLGKIVDWAEDPITIYPEQEVTTAIMTKSGGESKSKMEEIQVEDIQVIQEVDEKVAKFCFMYNHEISNKTAQYEIILINKKGNWKRGTMKTEMNDSHDCSASIDFPLEQFDEDSELKMLVVARDINTGKVLASEEKTLQRAAQKVVGPAVDNNSEGYISTVGIVGAMIGGVACLMALVAAAIMFVMQRMRNDDGLQYPLHRTNIEDSNVILGLDSPYPTM